MPAAAQDILYQYSNFAWLTYATSLELEIEMVFMNLISQVEKEISHKENLLLREWR